MKITKDFVILLARRHYIELDETQIKELVFELTYLQDHFFKQWKDLNLGNLPLYRLPFSLKNNYLRSDDIVVEQSKNDFFLNLNHYNEKHLVFIAKKNKKIK